MRLKVNFKDGTYKYSSSVSKRKIGPSSAIFKDITGPFEGTARIEYKHGGYNSFDFTSRDDFYTKALPAMDEYLDEQY